MKNEQKIEIFLVNYFGFTYLPPGELGRFSFLTNSEGPTPVDQTKRP
jgi:hypothetical protein